MRGLLLAWGPALAWAGFLLFLGTRPSAALPSGGLFELPGADKVLHAGAYALLGALCQRAAQRRSARGAMAAGVLAAALVGGLDELLQARTAGRSSDPWDLAADLAGAALGAWLRLRTFPPPARSGG